MVSCKVPVITASYPLLGRTGLQQLAEEAVWPVCDLPDRRNPLTDFPAMRGEFPIDNNTAVGVIWRYNSSPFGSGLPHSLEPLRGRPRFGPMPCEAAELPSFGLLGFPVGAFRCCPTDHATDDRPTRRAVSCANTSEGERKEQGGRDFDVDLDCL